MSHEYHPDFWLATATIGPVMFLAVGALMLDLMRRKARSTGARDRFVAVLLAIAFAGAALPTVDAILSLAQSADSLPTGFDAAFLIAAVFAFIGLVGLLLFEAFAGKAPGPPPDKRG